MRSRDAPSRALDARKYDPMLAIARAAMICLLALPLAAPAVAKHRDRGVVTLHFEVVEGLVIAQVKTSAGDLRLLIDTGSNATTLDEISPPADLVIKLQDCELLVKPYPTLTPAFTRFNATVPKEQRANGVLGQDFLSQFSSVAFDYAHHRVIFVR